MQVPACFMVVIIFEVIFMVKDVFIFGVVITFAVILILEDVFILKFALFFLDLFLFLGCHLSF